MQGERQIFRPSRFYVWFCRRTERQLGELNLTEKEWQGVCRDYVAHRTGGFYERLRTVRSRPKLKQSKRRYRITKRGIVLQRGGIPSILNRLYSSECAWVILCGEAKAMKVNSSAEVARKLKQRYPFLTQTNRESFVDEVCSESPKKLGEKELAEYLGVKPDSVPVMLTPSQWPKSEPKWLSEIMTKRLPAEFDLPFRPNLRRPRK